MGLGLGIGLGVEIRCCIRVRVRVGLALGLGLGLGYLWCDSRLLVRLMLPVCWRLKLRALICFPWLG